MKFKRKPNHHGSPKFSHPTPIALYIQACKTELREFVLFLRVYIEKKTISLTKIFEGNKNTVVKSILIKRGKRNRMFLHISAMTILCLAVLASPYISDSNPFSQNKDNLTYAQELTNHEESLTPDNVFETTESEKPRDKIITYTVERGDTLSTIAKKFQISEDTIKWQNNLEGDTIAVGDKLEILPVTGIAYKVAHGDTVYTIAKKYQTNPQGIVDFPFNDFANPQTFSLIDGQIVIVPDGIKPEVQKMPQYAQPKYYAKLPGANSPVSSAGWAWPIHGSINQFYSWYHRALDLGDPIGTPIMAAQNGTVAQVFNGGYNGGYGTHVIISGDNGYSTLYAHMMATNVTPGQRVTAGSSVIGWIGMTGRTTGPHVHFEIRSGGNILNPISFLP